ncbi:MAG: glycosyltransferase family 2 protein [Syntrophobacterales bacterium]
MRLNQNNNPLISIVIATRITPERNRLNELERAIDSSIAQDYQPVEIIVLDDCSDINLNFLGEKSELIKIYRSKNNIGAAKIRNKGFFISKGKYVISLDDDAYFSDNNIVSSVVTQFEKLANVAIICMPIIKDKSHNLSLSENKTKRDGKGIIKGYSDSPTFWQQRQPVAPRTWRQYRRLLKQPEDYVAEW